MNERRPWIAPDLPVALNGRDYFEGRDPVLDAVLAFKAPESLADQRLWTFEQGGIDAAGRRLYFMQTDPATASLDYFSALRQVGRALLGAGRTGDAVRVFQQNLRSRPDAPDAHADLGEAHLAAGNRDEALTVLENGRSIRPDDPRILNLLGQARAR